VSAVEDAHIDVGIVGGTGPLGQGLAVRLAAAGVPVALGSRQAERAAEVCQALQDRWPGRLAALRGVTNEEAADPALVVLATPWEAAVATAAPLADRLVGKPVVSVGNALVRLGREAHAVVPPRGSVAAMVQAALPEARVVAAGHHLPAPVLVDLERTLEADVLVCGDDRPACQQVADLLQRVPGLRPLLAGSLAQAAAIEAFTAVLVTVNMGHRAHATPRLAGVPGHGDGATAAG
jgi:NADPH-dependent F420 reductase